jgi:hypothetical protein
VGIDTIHYKTFARRSIYGLFSGQNKGRREGPGSLFF